MPRKRGHGAPFDKSEQVHLDLFFAAFQRLLMYIVTSKPKRTSLYEGVSQAMMDPFGVLEFACHTLGKGRARRL